MSSGEYRVPRRVAVVDDDPAAPVYVARLPDGPLMVLEETGAMIWRAVRDVGVRGVEAEEAVVARVAATVGCDAEEIRPDVVAFLGRLVAQGLLERASD